MTPRHAKVIIAGAGFSGLGMAIRLRKDGIHFYLDASGRNATIWPDWTWLFRRRCSFEPSAYELSPARRSVEMAA